VNFGGAEKYSAATDAFITPQKLATNSFALDGAWKLGTQSITPSAGEAKIALKYSASEVRMVLAGSGTVKYTIGGVSKTITVSGTPKSYPLIKAKDAASGTLTVSVSPGVEAFSFTFG